MALTIKVPIAMVRNGFGMEATFSMADGRRQRMCRNFQTRTYRDGRFSVQTDICPHYYFRLEEPVRGVFPVWPDEDPEN